MITYNINRKKLIIDSEKIKFEHTISKVEEIDELLIVLLKNIETGDVTKQPINNIYAVDRNGKIVWNINDIVGNNEFFGGFYKLSEKNMDSKIVAVDCMGKRHTIDLKSMKVVETQGVRF